MLYTVIVSTEHKNFAENFSAKSLDTVMPKAVTMRNRYTDVKFVDIYNENGELVKTFS